MCMLKGSVLCLMQSLEVIMLMVAACPTFGTPDTWCCESSCDGCACHCHNPQGGDSAPSSRNTGAAAAKPSGASKALNIVLPLLLILAAVLVNMYLNKK